MDYVQCRNLEDLTSLYEHVAVRNLPYTVDPRTDPNCVRRYRWLTRNVKNHLLDCLHKTVDSWFSGSYVEHNLLGLTVDQYVVPRDLNGNPPLGIKTRKRLDVFKLTELQQQAHHMGATTLGFSNLEEHQNQCDHLCEALEANFGHKRHWDSISTMEAVKIADEWVKRLARQKLETSGTWELLEDLGDGLTVVKLLDEDAYKAEGALMHHCVATYWGGTSSIYSLRKGTQRLVTFEVKDNCVVQARGPNNAAPRDDEQELLTALYQRQGWSPRASHHLSLHDVRVGLAGHMAGINLDAMCLHTRAGVFLPQSFVASISDLVLVDGENQHTLHVVNADFTTHIRGNQASIELTVEGACFPQNPATLRVTRNGVNALVTGMETQQDYENLASPFRTHLTLVLQTSELQQFFQGN